MKTHNEFTIPFLGLSNGAHLYDFKLDNSFFASFEKSSIENGEISSKVTFDKQDRTVVLLIDCKGYFNADCDRCLAPIQVPVDFNDKIILKIEQEPHIKEDEVYYLEPHTSHIDLSSFIIESIHLYLPMKNIRDCDEEDFRYCDQEVLKNLDQGLKNEKASFGKNPWGDLDKLNLE